MSDKDSIIGFFMSVSHMYNEGEKVERQIDSQFEEFATYISATNGLANTLRTLNRSDYGRDITLILFQLYVFPSDTELSYVKELERYRPSEKSVGASIVITNDNFFNNTDEQRRSFLRTSIMNRLDLLDNMVKRRKFDTDMSKLKLNVHDALLKW